MLTAALTARVDRGRVRVRRRRARLDSLLLGPQLGAFAGALLLDMGSNALARLRNRPAVTTVVPSLMRLVLGSVGFHSLASLLERNVVAGIDTAFAMLLVAVARAATPYSGDCADTASCRR